MGASVRVYSIVWLCRHATTIQRHAFLFPFFLRSHLYHIFFAVLVFLWLFISFLHSYMPIRIDRSLDSVAHLCRLCMCIYFYFVYACFFPYALVYVRSCVFSFSCLLTPSHRVVSEVLFEQQLNGNIPKHLIASHSFFIVRDVHIQK